MLGAAVCIYAIAIQFGSIHLTIRTYKKLIQFNLLLIIINLQSRNCQKLHEVGKLGKFDRQIFNLLNLKLGETGETERCAEFFIYLCSLTPYSPGNFPGIRVVDDSAGLCMSKSKKLRGYSLSQQLAGRVSVLI